MVCKTQRRSRFHCTASCYLEALLRQSSFQQLLDRNRTPRVKRLYRNKALVAKYGISHRDYLALLREQDGKCAICGATVRAKGRQMHGHKHFAVDHDHRTKRVRGLLCAKCNVAIGFLNDDPTIVLAAFKYLTEA